MLIYILNIKNHELHLYLLGNLPAEKGFCGNIINLSFF